MQEEIQLQTFRFWCTARSVRLNYVYASEHIVPLSYDEKLKLIDYQINTFTFSKPLLKKFAELRTELVKTNELNQPAEAAS